MTTAAMTAHEPCAAFCSRGWRVAPSSLLERGALLLRLAIERLRVPGVTPTPAQFSIDGHKQLEASARNQTDHGFSAAVRFHAAPQQAIDRRLGLPWLDNLTAISGSVAPSTALWRLPDEGRHPHLPSTLANPRRTSAWNPTPRQCAVALARLTAQPIRRTAGPETTILFASRSSSETEHTYFANHGVPVSHVAPY